MARLVNTPCWLVPIPDRNGNTDANAKLASHIFARWDKCLNGMAEESVTESMWKTDLPSQRAVLSTPRPIDKCCGPRLRQRVAILGLLLGVMCVRPALAALPANRLADEIRKYKDTAAAVRHALAGLMVELEQAPVFTKLDGPLITKHMEEVAQGWTEAAAALEKGDETSAAALARRAEEMAGQRDRWQERLRWRRLQSQYEYLPATAEIYFLLAPERNGDVAKEVEAFLEAKKQRSEAYGRLAEETTPTADRKTLFRLQDEAFAFDVEVWVADMKYAWAREDWDFRTWVATDPRVASPELAATKEHLAEWRRQREAAYRQSRSRQHVVEQLDREHDNLISARERAYRTAKAARGSSRNSP
jgi:hypothetical protein